MKTEEIVNKFRLQEDTTDSRWKDTSRRVWQGSRYNHAGLFADSESDWFMYDRELTSQKDDGSSGKWVYVANWADGVYRAVWINHEQRATFTYCEGDLTLSVCGDQETFDKELREAADFYGPM